MGEGSRAGPGESQAGVRNRLEAGFSPAHQGSSPEGWGPASCPGVSVAHWVRAVPRGEGGPSLEGGREGRSCNGKLGVSAVPASRQLGKRCPVW